MATPVAGPSQYLADTFVGGLLSFEVFWRDHKEWLEEKGYALRPRYHPEWVPSWIKSKDPPRLCEDGPGVLAANIMDARRISDGSIVVLKRAELVKWDSPNQELKMAPLFSTDPFISDSRNHCIQVLETLNLPHTEDEVLLVMPYLKDWEYPPFDTIGEVVEFCRQLFEGLQLMHEHRVAHNDIKYDNIMMDSTPLYGRTMHPINRYAAYDWKRRPKNKTRTRRPVKYYYIDFDLCEQYNPNHPALKAPGYGGDKTVPEYKYADSLCDPFAVDVYHLANVLRSTLTGGAPDEDRPINPVFAFMQPLIDDMAQDDPKKRPKMDQVVSRFSEIVDSLSQRRLRSPVWQDASFRGRFVRKPLHWCRQLYYMATRVPAIPTPE